MRSQEKEEGRGEEGEREGEGRVEIGCARIWLLSVCKLVPLGLTQMI